MNLKHLHLHHFKSYSEIEIDFSESINGIVGMNGCGKTNLLDAIYCMSLTKSAFFSTDAHLIKDGETFFAIKGQWNTGKIIVSLKKGETKKISFDGSEYERVSEHIGKLPIVLIQPDDLDLIKEGSEVRRKFINVLISQLDQEYLTNLMQYNKLLKQRNALLKQYRETRHIDKDLVETYDVQLLSLNSFIYRKRKEVCLLISSEIEDFYKQMSNGGESVSFIYQSQCSSDGFEKEYKDAYPQDLYKERTTMGTHKDDFIFKIKEKSLKKMGSQGQKKSYVTALQLAKYKVMEEQLKVKPLLLLDDIFDKLDEGRIKRLLELVKSKLFGQIFITDASKQRFEYHIKQITTDYNLIEIKDDNH